MDFDDWMLTKDPKYHPTDDTVVIRRLRECWNDAQKLPERSMLVQPDLIKAGGQYPENVWKAAQRLAYKLANMTPSNVEVQRRAGIIGTSAGTTGSTTRGHE